MEGNDENEDVWDDDRDRFAFRLELDQTKAEAGETITGRVLVYEDDDRPLRLRFEVYELSPTGGRGRHIEHRDIAELAGKGELRADMSLPFSITIPDDAEAWSVEGTGGVGWRLEALLPGRLLTESRSLSLDVASSSGGETVSAPVAASIAHVERERAMSLVRRAKYWDFVWSLFFIGCGLFVLFRSATDDREPTPWLVAIGVGFVVVAGAIALWVWRWPLAGVGLSVDGDRCAPGESFTTRVENDRHGPVQVGFRRLIVGESNEVNAFETSDHFGGSDTGMRPVASATALEWIEVPPGATSCTFTVPADARPTWGGKTVAVAYEVIAVEESTDTPFPRFSRQRPFTVEV